MTNKNIVSTHNLVIDGKNITAYRIKLDANGNPRYVVHFLELGIENKDYGKIPFLTKYRAKWFGGGYVFQSYNIEEDLKRVIDVIVKGYYS